MDLCSDSSSSITDEEDDDLSEKRLNAKTGTKTNDATERTDYNKILLPNDWDISRPDDPIIHNENKIKDKAQLEKDKIEVYRHPLFPLLALMLEKCELATATLGLGEDMIVFGESLNSELKAFIQHQTEENGLILGNNSEVDTLMIKAIQVLRIHLLELEKVQDLCKDFCHRYITCLRTKMNSENLLRGTSDLNSAENSSDSSTSSDECSSGPSNFAFNEPNNSIPTDFPAAIAHDLSKNKLLEALSNQIGNQLNKNHSSENEPQNLVIDKPLNLAPRIDSGTEGDLSDEASSTVQKRSQKRGILPKQATSVMRSWLFQHIVHPYPTEDEKRTIAAQTNLTLLQVNNWFINARRRILQPMLDSANINNNSDSKNGTNEDSQTSSKESNAIKKLKTNNKNSALHRFWPESIANNLKSTTKDSPKKIPS